jgi:hypothetical protein
VKSAPDAAASLLAEAKGSPVSHLADACRAVKARADDPAARAARHHRSRRTWFATDPDGMVELRALLPVASGAAVRTALEKRTDQIFRERRRGDAAREPRDRYMADALVELVRGAQASGVAGGGRRRSRPVRTNVQVRVDLAALRRGRVAEGELCDAPGVGELTVGEVEALIAEDDVVIDALLTRGHDVLKTVRLDRYVTAEVRKALSFRDATCVVAGCGRKWRLEKDHLNGGYAATQRTQLAELAHLCPQHHRLKNAVWLGAVAPGRRQLVVRAATSPSARRMIIVRATHDDHGRLVGGGQVSGSAAKSFLVWRYQPIPRTGFFHRACIALRAASCVASPAATASFRCWSWALITSLAVLP